MKPGLYEQIMNEEMNKALARLAAIDSRRLLAFLMCALPMLDQLDFSAMDMLEKRILLCVREAKKGYLGQHRFLQCSRLRRLCTAYRLKSDEHHLEARGRNPGEVYPKDEPADCKLRKENIKEICIYLHTGR